MWRNCGGLVGVMWHFLKIGMLQNMPSVRHIVATFVIYASAHQTQLVTMTKGDSR